jgi:branched-chain amino acid transport system substrate-binding protein
MNKKFSVMLAIVITIVMMMSVGVQAQDTETYVLGVAQPFTGSLGSFGEDFARGIELAVNQMNAELEAAGSPIRFEIASADTEQTPEGAARAVQTIVQTTGAEVIVGPLTTGEVLGAKQFADDNGVVLVAPASSGVAGAIPNDNIFRVMNPPDTFSAKAFAQIAVSRGYENMVMLYIDDPFGNGLVDSFTTDFQAVGGSEVSSIAYAPEAANLSSESAAASAEIASLQSSGETAFFCVCFLGDAQKVLQAAQVDPILSTVDWMGIENLANAEILEDSGHAELLANANFVSVSFSSSSTPLTPIFINDFVEAYGSEPGPFTNYAYDASNIAMLTMLTVGNDGEAVKSMLPFVANHYIGTAVQTYLDENGDQAIAVLGIYQVNEDGSDFEQAGTYDGSSDTVTFGG